MTKSADRMFEFVGGPLDGRAIAVGGSVGLGMEVTIPTLDGAKPSVYTFSDDGRFHFVRWAPPPLIAQAPSEGVRETIFQLAELLQQLDAEFDRMGGHPGRVEIGKWSLIRQA